MYVQCCFYDLRLYNKEAGQYVVYSDIYRDMMYESPSIAVMRSSLLIGQ